MYSKQALLVLFLLTEFDVKTFLIFFSRFYLTLLTPLPKKLVFFLFPFFALFTTFVSSCHFGQLFSWFYCVAGVPTCLA